jgi:hypothetical protein
VRLRTAQWDKFRQSSGAAQEIESQLKQVADGARAAVALAKRFLEEDAQDAWKASEEAWKGKASDPVPREKRQNEATIVKEGLGTSKNTIESAKQATDLGSLSETDVSTNQDARMLDEVTDMHRATKEDPLSSPSAKPIETSLGKDERPTVVESQVEIPQASIDPDIAEQEVNPFQMRESRVPSTRFGRLWQYGGLATSMAFGAVGESWRRATGSSSGGSLVLGPKNMERLVAKLSRMRGAALKLGQMISFQG